MEKSKSFPNYSSSYVKASPYAFADEQPKSYSFNGPSSKGDDFATSGNPDVKRKKRVASYNMYAKEGKIKSSLKNGFKWIKSKFMDNNSYFDV